MITTRNGSFVLTFPGFVVMATIITHSALNMALVDPNPTVSDRIAMIRVFDLPKTKILTNLPLQIALHLNIYFAPFWALSHAISLIAKYDRLSSTYRVILIAAHFVTILVETIRLYLGFYGNLGEKIPALSGFWITTVLLQMPIAFFLMINPEIYPLPIERAVYLFHLAFLLIEVVTGFMTIREIADYQVMKFKQRVMDSGEGNDSDKKL